MHQEINAIKVELELVSDIIDAKYKEKIEESYELFMKKYEKIEKITSPEELKATVKDITKYENKVQIYIRYIATHNQAEIEKMKANNMRA